MRIILISLIAFIGLTSAEGGCNRPKETTNTVVGKWRWVKTFCCGRGSQWTDPSTCNCTKGIEFKADGSYIQYMNGGVQKEGTYILRKGLNDYQYETGDTSLAIRMDEESEAYVVFNNDTLGITRGYMDLDNNYFVRER